MKRRFDSFSSRASRPSIVLPAVALAISLTAAVTAGAQSPEPEPTPAAPRSAAPAVAPGPAPAPAAAPAPAPATAPVTVAPAMPATSTAAEAPARVQSRAERESFWQAQIGMRSTFVTDKGFDPFASDNALTSFSLGFSRTLVHNGAFSFAPGVVWDYGGRSAAARGQSTSLSAHRLGLALEGRYHFAPWAYGLLRITPSAVQQSAKLEDGLMPAPYVASTWSFAVDASAGAAFLIGPHGDAPAAVRWWVAAEGGYGYASSASLKMRPDLADDDPRRVGDLDLGKVALGGAFFRIYGAVTF